MVKEILCFAKNGANYVRVDITNPNFTPKQGSATVYQFIDDVGPN